VGYPLPIPHLSLPIKPSGSEYASPQNSSQIYATGLRLLEFYLPWPCTRSEPRRKLQNWPYFQLQHFVVAPSSGVEKKLNISFNSIFLSSKLVIFSRATPPNPRGRMRWTADIYAVTYSQNCWLSDVRMRQVPPLKQKSCRSHSFVNGLSTGRSAHAPRTSQTVSHPTSPTWTKPANGVAVRASAPAGG